MKKIYSYLLVLVSCLFLSACLFEGGGSDSLIIGKSETDEAEDRRRERERKTEVSRGDCGEFADCEEVCEDVYNEDGDRENEGKVERCLELSHKVAIDFENIVEVIEEPDYDALRNIENKSFKAFLDISLAPWLEKTKRLNNSEAEALLRWIAIEAEIATAIEKAYDNYEDFDLYEGVEGLFEEIASDLSSYTLDTPTALERANRRCAEFCSAVANKALAGNRSFWDIASTKGNSSAQELACGIFKIKCRHEGLSVVSNVELSDCPASVSEFARCQL